MLTDLKYNKWRKQIYNKINNLDYLKPMINDMDNMQINIHFITSDEHEAINKVGELIIIYKNTNEVVIIGEEGITECKP